MDGQVTLTPPVLVTTSWLAERLSEPDIKPVDASWYLPQMNRDARAEFEAGHIPGAVFFDIEEASDTDSPYPHMLPAPETFARLAGRLGLRNDDHIVVYDGAGLLSAARVWWMFKIMGHDKVSVLNGGFPKWRREHRHEKAGWPVKVPKEFSAVLNTSAIRALEDMRALTEKDGHGEQILDARPAARFEGRAPEPRPGLPSGHMPASLNLPSSELLNADGTLKNKNDLTALFEKAGLDMNAPVVTTCGSGVTAAALSFGLALLGKNDVALYDGSWSEWAAQPDTRIETA